MEATAILQIIQDKRAHSSSKHHVYHCHCPPARLTKPGTVSRNYEFAHQVLCTPSLQPTLEGQHNTP
eukprot:4705303-Amphidinium_carterae.1